ncbi:MAG: putative permease [Clostridiales bacterium]|jgi:uncharacterized membrane protein YfcA|nr:putative permease [Clostridiales bacterium]
MDKYFLKILIIGFIAGLCNGIFGSGGGTILVPAMVFLLDIRENKSHATAIAVILPLSIISSVFYISSNKVNWNITYQVAIGSTIGGYIGSRILNKFSDVTLRKIFGFSMIAAALRLVL